MPITDSPKSDCKEIGKMDMPKNNLTVRDYIIILQALEGVKLRLVNEVQILDEDHTTEIETIEELIEKIKNVTT
jgi:hypothetical protein